MAECSHDCSSCSQKCSKESLLSPQNQASNVNHVIGVVSGKGGVGKSLVTSMLAVAMQRRGYKTAILDADITGPSIPKSFGLKCGSVEGSDLGILGNFRFAEPYASDSKKEYSDKVTPPEGMKLISTDSLPYRFYVPTEWKDNSRTASPAAYFSDSDSSNVNVQMHMMDDSSPTTVADYFKS